MLQYYATTRFSLQTLTSIARQSALQEPFHACTLRWSCTSWLAVRNAQGCRHTLARNFTSMLQSLITRQRRSDLLLL